MNKAEQLRNIIQQVAAETPQFFERTGPGEGNRVTNTFIAELNRRATIAFGFDYSEQKICGDSNHAVDYYFEDEATIVEVALSLWAPNTEFEKDIFKALLAKETYPVERLVLIGKPGSQASCAMPGRRGIIDWVSRNHHLSVEVYDIKHNHRS